MSCLLSRDGAITQIYLAEVHFPTVYFGFLEFPMPWGNGGDQMNRPHLEWFFSQRKAWHHVQTVSSHSGAIYNDIKITGEGLYWLYLLFCTRFYAGSGRSLSPAEHHHWYHRWSLQLRPRYPPIMSSSTASSDTEGCGELSRSQLFKGFRNEWNKWYTLDGAWWMTVEKCMIMIPCLFWQWWTFYFYSTSILNNKNWTSLNSNN